MVLADVAPLELHGGAAELLGQLQVFLYRTRLAGRVGAGHVLGGAWPDVDGAYQGALKPVGQPGRACAGARGALGLRLDRPTITRSVADGGGLVGPRPGGWRAGRSGGAISVSRDLAQAGSGWRA